MSLWSGVDTWVVNDAITAARLNEMRGDTLHLATRPLSWTSAAAPQVSFSSTTWAALSTTYWQTTLTCVVGHPVVMEFEASLYKSAAGSAEFGFWVDGTLCNVQGLAVPSAALHVYAVVSAGYAMDSLYMRSRFVPTATSHTLTVVGRIASYGGTLYLGGATSGIPGVFHVHNE